MAKQIRGIILEGQSCSGKTSIFNAIKRIHSSDADAERNVIYLSEHYSQTLNWVNGELKNLSQEDNLQVLSDRLSMLEQLNNYANTMGEHSRRSRGLFFVFERFHLNYAANFSDMTSEEYRKIEQRLISLNALVVLCMMSPENISERLQHRAAYTKDLITSKDMEQYEKNQQRLMDIANKSAVPTMILNTDELNWDGYAKRILAYVQTTM